MQKKDSLSDQEKDYSLVSISIKSRWEGVVFIPKYLFDKWSVVDEKKGGESQITKIGAGRAYRGFKHLYEKVSQKGEKLVLSDESSKKRRWILLDKYERISVKRAECFSRFV